jgi:L,D-peptidoglycan transpeptidase YkuD (ErfK/YbiS/YcfS/YnhG family)
VGLVLEGRLVHNSVGVPHARDGLAGARIAPMGRSYGSRQAAFRRSCSAFGYAAHADTALPYAQMQAGSWCMDVVASPLYNRIVDASQVGDAAVQGSSEPMRLDLHNDGDQRYRSGFVIEHNPGARRGAGSCIFAHLWKAPGAPTAGCTAMADATMQRLYGWLRPDAKPVFVLLPQAEYDRLQAVWHLPSPSL